MINATRDISKLSHISLAKLLTCQISNITRCIYDKYHYKIMLFTMPIKIISQATTSLSLRLLANWRSATTYSIGTLERKPFTFLESKMVSSPQSFFHNTNWNKHSTCDRRYDIPQLLADTTVTKQQPPKQHQTRREQHTEWWFPPLDRHYTKS